MRKAKIYFCFASSPLTLGPFTVAPQTVWGYDVGIVSIGSDKFVWCFVEGDPQARLVAIDEMQSAASKSTEVEYPLDAIWPQGITSKMSDVTERAEALEAAERAEEQELQAAAKRAAEERAKAAPDESQAVDGVPAPQAHVDELNEWAKSVLTDAKSAKTDASVVNVIASRLMQCPRPSLEVANAAYSDRFSAFNELMSKYDVAQIDMMESPFEWRNVTLHDLVNFVGGTVSMQVSRGNSSEAVLTQWVRILRAVSAPPFTGWDKFTPMAITARPLDAVMTNLTSIISSIDSLHDAEKFIYPQRFVSQCQPFVAATFERASPLRGAHFAQAAKHLREYREATTKHLATCRESNARYYDGKANSWSPLYWADEFSQRLLVNVTLNPLIKALQDDPVQQDQALTDLALSIINREPDASSRSQAADSILYFLRELRPLSAPEDYAWDRAVTGSDRPNPAWGSLYRWLTNRVWQAGGQDDEVALQLRAKLDSKIADCLAGVKQSNGAYSAIAINVAVMRKFAQSYVNAHGAAAAAWVAYIESGCPDFNPMTAGRISKMSNDDIANTLREALVKVAERTGIETMQAIPDTSESALLAVVYTTVQAECQAFRRVCNSLCPLNERLFVWIERRKGAEARAAYYMAETDTEPMIDEVVNAACRKARSEDVSDAYLINFVESTVNKYKQLASPNRGVDLDAFNVGRALMTDCITDVSAEFEKHREFVHGGWALRAAPYVTSLFSSLSPVPFSVISEDVLLDHVKRLAKAIYPQKSNIDNAKKESMASALRMVAALIQTIVRPIAYADGTNDTSKWIFQSPACPQQLARTFKFLTSYAELNGLDGLVMEAFGSLEDEDKILVADRALKEFESSLMSQMGTSESNVDCSWEYLAAQRDGMRNLRKKLAAIGGKDVSALWRKWLDSRAADLLCLNPATADSDAVFNVAINAVRRGDRVSAEANAAKVLGIMARIAQFMDRELGADPDLTWVESRSPVGLRHAYVDILEPAYGDPNGQYPRTQANVATIVMRAFEEVSRPQRNPTLAAFMARLNSYPMSPYGERLAQQLEALNEERRAYAEFQGNVNSFGEDRSIPAEQAEYLTAFGEALNDLSILEATELKPGFDCSRLSEMLVLAVRDSLIAGRSYTVAYLATKFNDQYDTLHRLHIGVRPAGMRVTTWANASTDRTLAPTLRQGMRDLEAIIDSTDGLLELMRKNFSDVCEFDAATKPTPASNVDNGPPGRIVHAPLRTGAGSEGGSTYSEVQPSNPATGVDMDALFNLKNSNPQTQRVLAALGNKYGMYTLDESIIADLAKNSRHLGLSKKAPMANIVVVGTSQNTCILTANLGGQMVGIIMLNGQELTRLFGAFNTQSALHAITHELGHYVHRSLKGTKLLDWKQAIAGRRNLHPNQGKDGYAFDTEQFAILAEAMVWGDSCRGLYTCNGYNVVASFFVNNYLTEDDLKKVV